MSRPVSTKQRAKLFAICREYGIDNDDRRAIIKRVTGKGSLTSIDMAEAARVINDIEGKHGKGKKITVRDTPPAPRAPRTPGLSTDPITERQLWLISKLYEKLGANKSVQIAQNKETVKAAWPQTVGDGQKIIEMLKDQERRGFKYDGGTHKQV